MEENSSNFFCSFFFDTGPRPATTAAQPATTAARPATTAARPATCPPFSCTLAGCPYAKDKNGCSMCKCAPGTTRKWVVCKVLILWTFYLSPCFDAIPTGKGTLIFLSYVCGWKWDKKNWLSRWRQTSIMQESMFALDRELFDPALSYVPSRSSKSPLITYPKAHSWTIKGLAFWTKHSLLLTKNNL